MPSKRRAKHGGLHSTPKQQLQINNTPIPIIQSKLDPHESINNSYIFNSLSQNQLSNNSDKEILNIKQVQQVERNNYLLQLNKDQLKVECRKRGQKVNGTKMELLQRLGYKMLHSHPQPNSPLANSKSTGNTMVKSASNGLAPTLSFVKKQNARDRERERSEREKIVLWRHPILTISYCTQEMIILLQTYGQKTMEHKLLIAVFIALVGLVSAGCHMPGPHQILIEAVVSNMWFVTYWVGLGVLSSVGLGTGLHTFLLYLGPHIAAVTLAAYECNSLNFPRPPYPDEIICPENVNPNYIPSIWSIMNKVRPEAILWGAGTALGELPPYFMAKAARLSGYDPDDAEELQEFEELQKKRESGTHLSLLDRGKILMERIVERVGFLGILACASIPNPLFDLAGLTCGHFLVPFWTFFGATLIGKAVIKMHIQKLFVIIAFNETLIENAVNKIRFVPLIGKRLQEPFKTFLENQKTRLHRSSGQPLSESRNLLSKIYEKFVLIMIIYFVVSIGNSLAQSYHKRIHKKGNKVVHRKLA